MNKTNMPIYQVKITLQEIEPAIWRRVLVSSSITLAEFHQVIQAAMGWENAHLHMFKVGDIRFITPYDTSALIEMTAIDARQVQLCHIVPIRKPFRGEFGFEMDYEYDFGDDWQHRITFEDVLPPDPKQKIPTCTDGARACPPEDIGGIWGYQELTESDSSFDAEKFEIHKVNKRIKEYLKS